MDKVLGRILRSDQVKLEGQVQLQTKQPQSTAQPNSPKSAKQPATAVIAENHPEYAVVEITCCCGARMYLRCEYVSAEAPEGAGTMEQVNEQKK
jgi:hypothetical protein